MFPGTFSVSLPGFSSHCDRHFPYVNLGIFSGYKNIYLLSKISSDCFSIKQWKLVRICACSIVGTVMCVTGRGWVGEGLLLVFFAKGVWATNQCSDEKKCYFSHPLVGLTPCFQANIIGDDINLYPTVDYMLHEKQPIS